jgi:hypothetical protein
MVVDADTGEEIGNRFAKLFFADMEKLFELTSMESKLFFLMVRDSKIGGSNTFSMPPKRKRAYADALGLKTYRSITEMLKRMCMKDVIRDKRHPEEHPYLYQINPELVFKGTDYQRAKILVDYSGGQRKVFACKDHDDCHKKLDELKQKEGEVK